MERIFTYEIPEAFDGKTLLQFLKAMHYSAPILTHLKRTECGILLNGTWGRVRDLLHTGDVVETKLVEQETSDNIVPVDLPLQIVYEDQDLMVLNKPAGMPIHPSQGNYTNTLANAVAFLYAKRQEPFVYRCINRLDRDTTGLLILAKHMYSASLLSDMVKHRQIHRQYVAVVMGEIPESGTVHAPIGRVEGSTIEREVSPSGDDAVTHFRRLHYEDGYSLVSLQLETGRTHQIRVHMKHIGHPLPGDFLYCPDYDRIQRQALHSYQLSFSHPITKEPLLFFAPLPRDLQSFFSAFPPDLKRE